MTIDFGLPGQPGTDTANAIIETVGNGGNTSPLLVTVTLPEGQTVSGNEQQVAKAFAAIEADVPRLRVLDEGDDRRRAFRTEDDRTAYAMVFYAVPAERRRTCCRPRGSAASWRPRPRAAPTVGVTGMDVARRG